MYETELLSILEASQNNALTFFVGAGVSKLSDAPSWKELIDEFCDKLGRTKKDTTKKNAADFAGSGFRVEKITKDLYVQVLTMVKQNIRAE